MSNLVNKIDLLPRVVINKLSYPFQKKELGKLHKLISSIEPNSAAYCAEMALLSERMTVKGDILCNFEDGFIKQIANSDMPVIFVMNHSKQKRDPKMFATLNSLLSLEYFNAGKASSFPKPKIILNENIIKSSAPQMQDIFRKFGAVGINIHKKTTDNIKNLKNLISEYLEGKSNIFIFPEGKNCVRDDLPFEYRFQNGVSKMVQKVLRKGKPVKVVPLGFSYGKDKSIFGSIYVGKPVYFRELSGKIYTSKGNSSSIFAPTEMKELFSKGHETVSIQGIKGISKQIINNLKICMAEAEKRYKFPDDIRLL